jgi:3-oxoisoapionate decarboxylase
VTIGLGTYAFFWQWHPTAEAPLSLTDMVDRTADLGVRLFQICDYPAIESYESDDLDRLRVNASNREVPQHSRQRLRIQPP